jgi:hypothetical protein
MNWFRENRFLGTFAVVFGVATLGAVLFLFNAKGDWDEAADRFTNVSNELNRLQRLAPYPDLENLRKLKGHTEDYAGAVGKLKGELKMRTAPLPPLKPNEFQSQLRLAINRVVDQARDKKIRLPDKFSLGFDEFVAALPDEPTAPLLGQELVQLDWLVNALIEARVDALTALRRVGPSVERTNSAGVKPASGANAKVHRNLVEVTFSSTPAAARQVINQIVGAAQHFCIIRQLHVRNEKPTGPPRELTAETTAANTAASSSPSPAKATTAAALNFIVGNEKIETTAKIEIVRFAF